MFQIQELCTALELTNEKLREMMGLLLRDMEEGLSKEGYATATIKMLPSFVRSVPNGTEAGNFLALDLGGTNFRVLLIRLDGTSAEMSGKIYRVPHDLMVGTGAAVSALKLTTHEAVHG